MMRPERALIVGGTGMLAAASRWISQQGYDVTLAARSPDGLAHQIAAAPLVIDWSDQATSRATLATLKPDFDLGLVWLHEDAAWLGRPVEDLMRPGARCIRVHGALSVDPVVFSRRDPAPRTDILRQNIILGWHPDPDSKKGRRWLSNDEISAGTIDVLRDPSKKWLQIGEKAGP